MAALSTGTYGKGPAMAEVGEEYKAHVDALLAPIRDEMAKLAGQPGGIVSMAGCVCSYTWSDTGIVRNGPRADCPAHGDEDRIRDAMTESHDHPGRVVITCVQHGIASCPCLSAPAGGSAQQSGNPGHPGRIITR